MTRRRTCEMRLKGIDKFWDRMKENSKRGEMSEVCIPSVDPTVKLTEEMEADKCHEWLWLRQVRTGT